MSFTQKMFDCDVMLWKWWHTVHSCLTVRRRVIR